MGEKYSLDKDIQQNKSKFSPKELDRLSNYRSAINSVVVDGKMTKPTGEVLGEKLEDYIALTMKLPLTNSQ